MFKYLLLLVILVKSGYPLKCYKCAGPLGKGLACESDLKIEAKVECNPDFCTKYVIKEHDVEILTRDCQTKNICDKLKTEHNSTYNNLKSCYVCNDDLCNNGLRLTIMNFFLFSISFLLVFNQ